MLVIYLYLPLHTSSLTGSGLFFLYQELISVRQVGCLGIRFGFGPMKTHSVVPKDLGYTLTVSSDLSRLCWFRKLFKL